MFEATNAYAFVFDKVTSEKMQIALDIYLQDILLVSLCYLIILSHITETFAIKGVQGAQFLYQITI